MLVHSEGNNITVAVDLGTLCRIHTHIGCDRQSYVDIFFAHGRISLTSEVLLQLVDQGREAFVAAAAKKGRP